jgi:hypothetical protein
VLPEPPRTAYVFDGVAGWRDALEQADIRAVNPDSEPDLVVAPAHLANDALAVGAPSVFLEGRGARRSASVSYTQVERFWPLPTFDEPQILVPLEPRNVTAYVLRQWSAPVDPLRRIRNAVAGAVLRWQPLPEIRPSLTVATRRQGLPFVIGDARRFGIPHDASWFLTLGHGDVLTRAVFHIFRKGAKEPAWALKFSRVPGYSSPFDREERGLALATDGGETVAAHAPTLLARFVTQGLHASLETAASGTRLSLLLRRPGNRPEKRRRIDEIARWIVEIGLATRTTPDRLAEERARLRDEIVPLWNRRDLEGLAENVKPVPAVLQHNDLGSWNIIVSHDDFVAVDWESARRFGFPLWDLFYFVTDALVQLDGAGDPPARRDEYTALLWQGRIESSNTLFDWIGRAVDAFAIPPEDVGPIITLAWLHHGSSYLRRRAAGREHGVDVENSSPVAFRAAEVWLSSPGLGPEWDSWRRGGSASAPAGRHSSSAPRQTAE